MSISYVENGDSGLVARTLINQAIDGVNSGSLPYTGSAKITGSLSVTGSTTSTLGFTGSLQGTATTASYVLNAVSASFVTTASYVLNAVSASFASTASYVLQAVSASFASTASYVITAQTSSYVITAQTASYVLQAISASLALTSNKVIITDLTGSPSGNRMVFIKDIATGTTHIDTTGLEYTPLTKTYNGEANYNITSGSINLTGSLKLSGGGIAPSNSGIMYTDVTSGEIIVSNMVQFTATTTTITGGNRGTMNLSNLGTGGGASGLIIPTTIPSAPDTGSMYVDFGASKLYLYSGTAWVSSSLA
jgi:hypothetical protein